MSDLTGKLALNSFLNFIENKCGKERAEIKVKPKFGTDVSIINLSEDLDLAVASDPLSLIPQLGLKESAWLSVQLTANDIATTSYAPMYGQFVLNLPALMKEADFKTYWDYIHQYCKEIGLAITGGHTGFIENQETTVVGGATFFAVAPKNELLNSTLAEVGDKILVSKTCALVSSSILAMSFPETVKNKAGHEHYLKAAEDFYKISVLKEALIVAKSTHKKHVSAMHDVTEGGVLGAVYELALSSDKGAFIEEDKLPIGETQEAVCSVFSLDPRRVIGAGAMLISCKPEGVEDLIKDLKEQNIACTEIGEIRSKSEGVKIQKEGKIEDLIYTAQDPYWAAFYKAASLQWK